MPIHPFEPPRGEIRTLRIRSRALEGNLLETNLPYKTQYGWQREDLEDINIRDLVPNRLKPEFDRYLERIIRAGADEGLVKGFTKTGEEVIFEYRNSLIYDAHGRPKAVQGAARDVTRHP